MDFLSQPGRQGSLIQTEIPLLKEILHGSAFVKDSLWKEGDILIQHDLAETLKRIRDNGRDGFYSGKTASVYYQGDEKRQWDYFRTGSEGLQISVEKAITAEYKGYKIITVPPPSSGGIILIQLLKMIEPYPVKEWGFNSVRTIHLIAEAERRAFADRSEYSGDPDFVKVPVDQLINREYLAGQDGEL